MMGRYTIRAYLGRPIARISTERYDNAHRHSVSDSNEYEKQPTAMQKQIHIHYQRPTLIHRQSQAGDFYATTKTRAEQHSHLCLTHVH